MMRGQDQLQRDATGCNFLQRDCTAAGATSCNFMQRSATDTGESGRGEAISRFPAMSLHFQVK
jgi:hypothetical protein